MAKTEIKESIAVRFAGDSGDGMQLAGTRFTEQSAHSGNDLATRPDFPAEIRAPAGTLAGVSAFQVHFGTNEIYTAGDEVDALVAMNPAALKTNLADLKQNGLLICNSDAFTEKNLVRVGYDSNPLENDEELKTKFTLVSVPITTLTHEALKDSELSKSAQDKCKNFFALGIVSHIFGRKTSDTIDWLARKFASKEDLKQANVDALSGGVAYAEASEALVSLYEVRPAKLPAGTYRNVTGNQGLAYGLIAAARSANIPLFYSGYPITPASDILHELSAQKHLGVSTLQAEDEIAACGAALGAAYGGCLGVTASSGPGILLKQETIGLAVAAELPLVIVNVQRAGPSTGLPTKTEQADLLEVLYGRNGECPLPVLAISSPSDAFETTYQACKLALENMTPVFLLSDGSIGAGSEPWRLPDLSSLPPIEPPLLTGEVSNYIPYERDKKTLTRKWAVPGTKGAEHRIGGLEKQDGAGNISYDPANHEHMVHLRAKRIDQLSTSVPGMRRRGKESGKLLLVSWGSTGGAVAGAVDKAVSAGMDVGHVHLTSLHPFPEGFEGVLRQYDRVVVPELNKGQLSLLIRGKYLIPAISFSKVQGQPFKIREIYSCIETCMQSPGECTEETFQLAGAR